MAYTVAVSEFTDINNTDWKVKVVSSLDPGSIDLPFNLGPDGFNLNYDFDEYDRCKPVVGSRVQITLYHPIPNTAYFDAFYNALDSSEEGTFRIEIYRDPDTANEFWWAGTIMPEQTVIPDDYPHAPVTLTAVDGLANLKGIDYNNDGVAYTGVKLITEHLHNLIQKLHISDVWSTTDVELKFFEDFISKEYKDYIAGAQNEQLNKADIAHTAFYNKNENGDNEYFSCYKVLESLALTFNASVFMAQGSIWWVPLGAIQSHASSGTSIANYMLGDGTVTYNTVANVTTGAIFGSNSAQWEKLNGWERTSAPSFKEVKRTRNYQGDKPVVKDANYTQADIVAHTILDDEDVSYPVGRKFLISGVLRYEYPGDGTSINGAKISRLKLGLRVHLGDAGGSSQYLSRGTTYSANNFNFAQYWDSVNDTDENDFFYYNAIQGAAAWSGVASNYEIITDTFNKRIGTNGVLYIAFNFLTPEIVAAEGLELSVQELTGVTKLGANDVDLVDSSATYMISNFQANVYTQAQAQEFGTIDITATNPDSARYKLDQGDTLIGDRITDSDLGVIQVSDGNYAYIDATEWTNLQSSTASLSINGLGVRERLASNENAKRIERGTLYQRGSTYIHPYTILTNTADSGNFYQVTGLRYIANRCEYDMQCMYLSRNITGITVDQDNSKITPGVTEPDSVPGIKGPGPVNIVSDNTTKLSYVVTDSYGITGVLTSDGSGTKVGINLPVSKSASGTEIITINTSGDMAPLADGAVGEFLKTDGRGFLSWAPRSSRDLETLSDVLVTNVAVNDILKWSGSNWINDSLSQYHQRYETESEALRAGATATVELYYSAQGDGDGLAESAQSDTPTGSNTINRKIYYSETAFADPDTGTWVEFTPAPADDATFATVKAAILAKLKLRTGGTVPIALKMTWEETTGFTGLLDTYTGAAAAYSLRKLRTAYTGDAVEVYNGTSYADIGFTLNELDTVALAAHCGDNDGFVKTWYDQSGNANNASTNSTSRMPKIYDGDEELVILENGKPAVLFLSSAQRLTSTSATQFTGVLDNELYCVASYDSRNVGNQYAAGVQIGGGTRGIMIGTNSSGNDIRYHSSAITFKVAVGGSIAVGKQILNGGTTSGTSLKARLNGAIVGSQTGTTDTGTANAFFIGKHPSLTAGTSKRVQESIIYPAYNGNESGIETNINTFYSIY